ncbi:MAG: class I SAM-dependent methyltransferase [Syntrophotaleaceae bacterium]
MKTISLRDIACPVCRSALHEEVYAYRQAVHLDGQAWLWPARQVVCRDCGMVFTNPQPVRQALERFYSSYLLYGGVTGDRRMRENQLDFIERSAGRRLLRWFDIGANDGAFLSFAKGRGCQVDGIEPSAEAIGVAYEKYGLRLRKGFFDQPFVDTLRERFDLVSLNHVLEHVPDPLSILSLARQILADRGVLYVEVPDLERPNAANIADFFTVEHLMYFTATTLECLAQQAGLEVVACEASTEKPAIRVLLEAVTDPKPDATSNAFLKNRRIVGNYAKNDRHLYLPGKIGSQVLTAVSCSTGPDCILPSSCFPGCLMALGWSGLSIRTAANGA